MIDSITIKIDNVHKQLVGHNWYGEELHTDPYSRLYYVTEGVGHIETRGRTWPLRKGHCYLIDSNHPFRHIDSPSLDHYWIHFRAFALEGMSLFKFLTCPIEIESTNTDLFQRMLDTFPPHTLAANLRLQGIVKILLAEFIQQSERKQLIDTSDFDRFKAVLLYINDNLASPIATHALARMMHLHPNYFSNAFTHRFGISPRQYITQRRIHQAQILLWNTDLTLTQIARKVGYEDHCYFARVFRKQAQITPGQYRKQRPT